MFTTDDRVAVSLPPNLELELLGPEPVITEEYRTVRESVDSLWPKIDERNSGADEAADASDLAELEGLLDTAMSSLSLQESYHIASHASPTKSLPPPIEDEDIMEGLYYHYYDLPPSYEDISYHYTTHTSEPSFDLKSTTDFTIYPSTVPCKFSSPSPLYTSIMSLNYDSPSCWIPNSPVSYASSLSFSCSRSDCSYSLPQEDVSKNMDYMDIDDPNLYETPANNPPIPVTARYQPPASLKYRALQKRKYRSRRGFSGSLSPPWNASTKLEASSRPYLIPSRAQRHRQRLKLRRIFQECISMCRSCVFL